jgi:hypothetical protein
LDTRRLLWREKVDQHNAGSMQFERIEQSSRKGLRAEYQTRDLLIAAGLPARKVSRAYQPGNDLDIQAIARCA